MKILEEVEGDPAEELSVGNVGATNYVTRSTAIGPMIVSVLVLIGTVIGFICYECSRTYKDKFGRETKGSITTAFKRIGSWFSDE